MPFPRVFVQIEVNIIAQLDFELAHYDSAVQHFNYYTMRTPPDVLVSYTGHLLGGVSYSSADIQLACSSAPADRAC